MPRCVSARKMTSRMAAPDEGNNHFHHDIGGRDADKAGQPSTKKPAQDPDHDVPYETHAFAC